MKTILPDTRWLESVAGGERPNPVRVLYSVQDGTEIVVWNRNVFGGALHCGMDNLMRSLAELRVTYRQ